MEKKEIKWRKTQQIIELNMCGMKTSTKEKNYNCRMLRATLHIKSNSRHFMWE